MHTKSQFVHVQITIRIQQWPFTSSSSHQHCQRYCCKTSFLSVFGTSFGCLLIQHRPVLPLPLLPIFTLYCFYLLFYYFLLFLLLLSPFVTISLLPPVSYISSFILQLHSYIFHCRHCHHLSLCKCMHLIMMKVEKLKCC